ncbi:MAG: OmpA family protein [Thermomonas sp.]
MRGFLFILLLLVTGSAFADATVPTKDIAGAKDPVWLQRYEGSFIVSYDHRGFDAVAFPASKLIKSEVEDDVDAKNNTMFRSKRVMEVEGEYTRLVYVAPEDRSPLEVMRNYIDLINAAGGTSRYGCQDKACGGEIYGNDHGGGRQGLMEKIYPQNRLKDEAFSNGACATGENPGEQRYLLATIPDAKGKDRTLAVYTFSMQGDTYCKAQNGRTGILIVAVEPKAREKKMVTVSSGDMAKALAADGRISLYGIYFDTNKSTVKPDSKSTLEQIAALLKSQPTLRLGVVGHTDNVGGVAPNLKLSERRAAAIVTALVEDYGIDESRLEASGAGMSKPVADNGSEQGRAKNRRVELVKR